MKKYHLRRRRSLEVRCIIIITGQLFVLLIGWKKKFKSIQRELGHHLVFTATERTRPPSDWSASPRHWPTARLESGLLFFYFITAKSSRQINPHGITRNENQKKKQKSIEFELSLKKSNQRHKKMGKIFRLNF
jgi:hypothetical protein